MTLPSPLRSITLWQPYAWALIFAGKDYENRPRSLGVTGWVAVHVSLRWDLDYIGRAFEMMPENRPPTDLVELNAQLGHIIGLVNIVHWAPRDMLPPSPWLQKPPGVAAVIRGRMGLQKPVPCRHGFHRGAWRVPEDIERLVRDQMLRKDTL